MQGAKSTFVLLTLCAILVGVKADVMICSRPNYVISHHDFFKDGVSYLGKEI